MAENNSAIASGIQPDAIIPKWWRSVDTWTVYAVVMLFCLGIILSFASSPPLAEKRNVEPLFFVFRHVFFGGLGITIMLSVSILSIRNARRLGCIVFLVSLAGIMLLPIFGSDFGKGANRWFSLGFGSLQPSEFLKPGLIVVSAWLISGSKEENGPPGFLLSLIITLFSICFLVMQPDFGQAVLVLFGWSMLYFVSGAAVAPLVFLGGATILCGYFAYLSSEHFSRRIDEFLMVLSGTSTKSVTQLDFATDAISNGGLFGTGAGEGTVKWYLPDAHTDLIIAVAAEEYGLVMVVLIALLFVLILWKSISRLAVIDDHFTVLAGAGLISSFSVQALINISVAVRLVPPKGMTLPMISQGGSSMLAIGLLLGMLLSFTRLEEKHWTDSNSWEGKNLQVN